jgi:hypothetical protein
MPILGADKLVITKYFSNNWGFGVLGFWGFGFRV